MKTQSNELRQSLLLVTIVTIILLATSAFTFAQDTSGGSYNSPVARAIRQQIMNRAIMRQVTRGRGGKLSQHRARRRHRR